MFLIHGQKDTLIPYSQSQGLYEACSKQNKHCHYWYPLAMDHNSYDLNKDILIPIDNFLRIIKYKIKNDFDFVFSVPDRY